MTDPDMNGIQSRDEPANLQAGHAQADAAPATPGAILAASREAHGWAIEQVAAYLKLAPRQILALERDDYDALPGMPIVRGFVRSYAKLLKIDAAPLLAGLGDAGAAVNESLKPKEGLATPFSEARLPSMSEKPAMSSKWVIGVLLVVLLAAGFWALQLGGRVSSPVTGTDEPEVVEESLEVPQPRSDEQADATPPEMTQPAGTETQEAARPVPDAATMPALPAEEASRPAASTAPDSAPGAEQAATANALNLVVREESWIEIRSARGGRTLMARLAQPGENISIAVNEPVDLVVGNAAGVDATLRGAPFPLVRGTSTNVARISVK